MPGALFRQAKNSSFVSSVENSGENIPIDIIVPVHGRLDLTIKCIRAIYENTKSPFHLIVMDDTEISDDDPESLVVEYFNRLKKNYDNITYVHSDVPYKEGNEFFNKGFDLCKHEYVAVCMNSVTVEPEWDAVAVDFMKGNPQVGIIGFKCLLRTGTIESAGITMMGFTPLDIGRDSPGYQLSSMHECIAVQWAFALLRLNAVKGNLEEGVFYGFVGWDDIDNSFCIRKRGWQAWYCGLGAGVHETRATRGNNTPDALMKNRYNAEMFYKRWGYWDLYQKANQDDNIHAKSKLSEEVRGLAFTLADQKKKFVGKK